MTPAIGRSQKMVELVVSPSTCSSEAHGKSGIESIDIPVKEIDNATMLRIMANENMEDWKADPAMVLETVRAAKEFIEAELEKFGTWEEFRSRTNALPNLFESEPEFRSVNGKGVGERTILKFLGGSWKQWQIQNALKVIKEEERRIEAEQARGGVGGTPWLVARLSMQDLRRSHKILKDLTSRLARLLIVEKRASIPLIHGTL